MKKPAYNYTTCRAVTGHHWVNDPTVLVKAPASLSCLYGWAFHCAECHNRKIVFYDGDGSVLRTRYTNQPDYKTTREKKELRLAWLSSNKKART